MILAMLSRVSTAKVVGCEAMQVAKRGSPSIIDISPSVMPGPEVVMCCCSPRWFFLRMSISPPTMSSMKSPSSPSRMMISPGSARKTSM